MQRNNENYIVNHFLRARHNIETETCQQYAKELQLSKANPCGGSSLTTLGSGPVATYTSLHNRKSACTEGSCLGGFHKLRIPFWRPHNQILLFEGLSRFDPLPSALGFLGFIKDPAPGGAAVRGLRGHLHRQGAKRR